MSDESDTVKITLVKDDENLILGLDFGLKSKSKDTKEE